MTHINIDNTDWFQNCISGTHKVSKYIANLVGIILHNQHDMTYTYIRGGVLLRKNITHQLLCPTSM